MVHNFEVMNEYFDKTFVLTIHRNKERQDFISNYHRGLNFDFFYGIDGGLEDKLYDNYDDFKAKINCGRSLSSGEIACSMTHKLCCQYIVDSNYDKVLIIEDDAYAIEENMKYLNFIFNQLPDDWELLYLGYGKCPQLTIFRRVKVNIYYPITNWLKIKYPLNAMLDSYTSYIRDYSDNLKFAGMHDLAFAYAIRKSSAIKIIKQQSPVANTADGVLRQLCREGLVKAYISIPEVFLQRKNIISSIWNQMVLKDVTSK